MNSWRETYTNIFPPSVLDKLNIEEKTEIWKSMLSNSDPEEITLVAAINGSIVGFASAGKSRTPELAIDGELKAIYILKAQHRLGIGRALVRQAIDHFLAIGLCSMHVWVLRDNDSCRFYESLSGILTNEMDYNLKGTIVRKHMYQWDNLEKINC